MKPIFIVLSAVVLMMTVIVRADDGVERTSEVESTGEMRGQTPVIKSAADVRAPSLKKIFAFLVSQIEKGHFLSGRSVDTRVRAIGTQYRFYEFEVSTSIVRGSEKDMGEVYPNGDVAKLAETIVLPITVAVRVDLKDPSHIEISKFRISPMKLHYVSKPAGFEFEGGMWDFGLTESQVLNLGRGFGIDILFVRLKQVFDLTDEGRIRLVVSADAAGGFRGAFVDLHKVSEGDTERYDRYQKYTAQMGWRATGAVGVAYHRKYTVQLELGADTPEVGAQEIDGHLRINDISSRFIGGSLQWDIKESLRASLRVAKAHYQIDTIENDGESSKSLNPTTVDVGVKFDW